MPEQKHVYDLWVRSSKVILLPLLFILVQCTNDSVESELTSRINGDFTAENMRFLEDSFNSQPISLSCEQSFEIFARKLATTHQDDAVDYCASLEDSNTLVYKCATFPNHSMAEYAIHNFTNDQQKISSSDHYFLSPNSNMFEIKHSIDTVISNHFIQLEQLRSLIEKEMDLYFQNSTVSFTKEKVDEFTFSDPELGSSKTRSSVDLKTYWTYRSILSQIDSSSDEVHEFLSKAFYWSNPEISVSLEPCTSFIPRTYYHNQGFDTGDGNYRIEKSDLGLQLSILYL